MPVTRADELDARPADTAKELLALDVDTLAQEIRRVDGSNSFGAGVLAEALMPFIISHLSARQQPLVEEIGLLAFKELVHPSQDWNGPQYKADKADCLEFARALLAKYDIFQKVEG